MNYQTLTIIAARKALVLRIIARYAGTDYGRMPKQAAQLANRLCDRIGARPYDLVEAGRNYTSAWYTDDATAAQAAIDGIVPSNYQPVESTLQVTAVARDAITGDDCGGTTVTIEPDEPDCTPRRTHEWQSPHSVVGGLRENPGVHGHGGGVVITKVCPHCGSYRVQDTDTQDLVTGEQGLRSVTYRDADATSRKWLALHKRERAENQIDDILEAEDRVALYVQSRAPDGVYDVTLKDAVDRKGTIASIQQALNTIAPGVYYVRAQHGADDEVVIEWEQ